MPRRPQQAREHLWDALRHVLQRLHRNCHCVLLKKALLGFFLINLLFASGMPVMLCLGH